MEKHCRVTPGGSAYSRKEPWGNIGMSLQAVCSAGIYAKLNPGDKGAACFIKRQLGFVTNHKCAGGEGKCNTPTPEGFSYMVGCALVSTMVARIQLVHN
jgi:hypothetical protein